MPFGGGGGFAGRIKTGAKQKKQYTPSAFSIGFGIKGKSTFAGVKTGLGIRPIGAAPSNPFKVKKKKKKKKR